jgi:AcrR family transcriptional regulator
MTAQKPAAKPAAAYHHGDLRRALLEAAAARLDQEGADQISLAAIARTLGVSQAAPYRHFPDRDALLAATAAEGFRLFGAALRDAAAQGTGRRATLLRMCRAYVAFGAARPGLYRLMFDSSLLARANLSDELKTAAQASFALLVDALPATGTPLARTLRARRIWVALHGTVMLDSRGLLDGDPEGPTLDQLVEDILA